MTAIFQRTILQLPSWNSASHKSTFWFPAVFIFLSRQPNVKQLRASGRNWSIVYHHDHKGKKPRVFCIVFRKIMLRCKEWSVLHANEWRETSRSKVAGNWCRQWTNIVTVALTRFNATHLGSLATVKVDIIYYSNNQTSHPHKSHITYKRHWLSKTLTKRLFKADN